MYNYHLLNIFTQTNLFIYSKSKQTENFHRRFNKTDNVAYKNKKMVHLICITKISEEKKKSFLLTGHLRKNLCRLYNLKKKNKKDNQSLLISGRYYPQIKFIQYQLSKQ
jgi:hypothetical protein